MGVTWQNGSRRGDGFSEGDSLNETIQMTHFSEKGKIRYSVEVVGCGG